MASQSDLKPIKTRNTSISAPSSEGPGKACSNNYPAEESPSTPSEIQKHFLNHREAEAGGPADCAACGEEDPGVALEMLVEDTHKKNSQ